ncbi:MAG: TlpA disulfide reductase family protein [Pyrinomonadaceae bacterium]
MSLSKLLFVVIIAVLSFSGMTACSLSSATTADSTADRPKSEVVRAATVGNMAPEFELAKLDGTTVSFEDLQGEPAVIVFWTAWCPTCKEEAPEINKLAASFGGKGVRVLGVNIGEGEARVREGIKEFGIEYDVVRDADTTVAKRYGVVGTPTIVFLDRDGITRYAGNELPADYAERLKELTSQN